jgi:hypothetical protein
LLETRGLVIVCLQFIMSQPGRRKNTPISKKYSRIHTGEERTIWVLQKLFPHDRRWKIVVGHVRENLTFLKISFLLLNSLAIHKQTFGTPTFITGPM